MQIFIPALLLGVYTLLFFFYLGLCRRAAVTAGEVDPRYYRTFSGGAETARLKILSRHAANLFEAPMLFYAIVLMIYVTKQTSAVFIGLAWAFLALRAAHAWVHLRSNYVPHRFLIFAASMIVLFAMWLGLLVMLLIN